jgi:hypothetical protein
MPGSRPYGSVRGALSNGRPYRDNAGQGDCRTRGSLASLRGRRQGTQPEPPHDGVRRARRLNLSRDLGHSCPPVLDSQRDHLAHRPHGNDAAPPCSGGTWNLSCHAVACLPQRNSLPSAHMRCRITESLRATATRARAMPQARSADHLLLRTSSECAASYNAVRAARRRTG